MFTENEFVCITFSGTKNTKGRAASHARLDGRGRSRTLVLSTRTQSKQGTREFQVHNTRHINTNSKLNYYKDILHSHSKNKI